jgi:hypothetical protein
MDSRIEYLAETVSKARETAGRNSSALAGLARQRGMHFYRADPSDVPAACEGTRFCAEGRSQRAYNVIAADIAGAKVKFFDFEYTVGKGRHTSTYRRSGCVLTTNLHCKQLLVRPENVFDKAAAIVGHEDIDLDNAEFNEKFHVSSEDKQFAYDVLNQRAMQFFLDHPGITMEAAGHVFLFYYAVALLPVRKALDLMEAAASFAQSLPQYLGKRVES